MSIDTKLAKQAIHDKLESQIKAAEAKLETLKARAAAAKANLELKAIAELLPKKQAIELKLRELKKSGDREWERSKADLETRITYLEKSIQEIESRVKPE